MAKRPPVTQAVRALRRARIPYTEHIFDYAKFPGAAGAALALGVDAAEVIKTLIMETNSGDGLVILMHGDREVSTKQVSRVLGVKSVRPTTTERATKWTGYEFGGTSPLGMRERLPILAEGSIARLSRVYINAGRRGFLAGLSSTDLLALVDPLLTEVAATDRSGRSVGPGRH